VKARCCSGGGGGEGEGGGGDAAAWVFNNSGGGGGGGGGSACAKIDIDWCVRVPLGLPEDLLPSASVTDIRLCF
jgi:hypothetical protein